MKNIPLTPVDSSQISHLGHDPETKTLRIRFKSHRENVPGSEYDYANYTAEQFTAFLKAESIGRHFGQTIKGNPAHPFTKLNPLPGK